MASTTSDLVYTPLNLFKHLEYWKHGVVGGDVSDMINLNEMNLRFEMQSRNRGEVVREKCCDAQGKFKKGVGHADLLMTIRGNFASESLLNFD